MQISAIRIFQVDLPLVEGRYTWSDGRYVEVFDATVVALETDAGFTGYGEVCPLGPFYLPAYGAGARAGIGELAPTVLGMDPALPGPLNAAMDMALLGHPYVKSAIDMACWDILGKQAGLPVCELLGGRHGDTVDLYRAISQGSAEHMAENVALYREQGYRKFQLKVGGDAATDILRIGAVAAELNGDETLVADANTGWRIDDAARVVNAVRDLAVTIEQPCLSYEHCLATRRRTALPFTLDENIDSLAALLKAHADGAMDAINLKISKVGGLSKARIVRDVCAALHIPMTIEDSWGGDITTAAIAHLAQSTAPEYRYAATDFNSYVTVSTASGAPERVAGTMSASTAPGLGIEPDFDALGKPVAEYS